MVGWNDNDEELLDFLNMNWRTREQIIKSDVQKAHDTGVAETLAYLQEVAQERNFVKLLSNERLMLMHTLKFDANSPEEVKSLEAAVVQLDESINCFNAMSEDPAAYKKMEATYSSKKKEAGLPLDAARDFFRSHATRLTNSLAAKGSHSDKQIIRQRKENLKVIQECYIELQQKTLGKKPPGKKQGLSR